MKSWKSISAAFFMISLVGGVLIGPCWAAKETEKAKVSESKGVSQTQEDEQKKAFVDQVKANIAALNLQGVTVQVLGMQYQKEQSSLQQMQAVFSDTYKLDVGKFREGLYRFDEKEGKFVEQKAS